MELNMLEDKWENEDTKEEPEDSDESDIN